MKGNWRRLTPVESTTVSELLFGMTLFPNMDQLVTRGCVRVPSLLWPSYSQSQLALCYFTCILLTIACHVPFFVDQRFVFSLEKRKFGHERYENFEKIGHALTEIIEFKRQDSKVSKNIANCADTRSNAAGCAGAKAKVRK